MAKKASEIVIQQIIIIVFMVVIGGGMILISKTWGPYPVAKEQLPGKTVEEVYGKYGKPDTYDLMKIEATGKIVSDEVLEEWLKAKKAHERVPNALHKIGTAILFAGYPVYLVCLGIGASIGIFSDQS